MLGSDFVAFTLRCQATAAFLGFEFVVEDACFVCDQGVPICQI